MAHTLDQLARRFSLELKGDGATPIDGVCGLEPGRTGYLSFYVATRDTLSLKNTKAAAVVLAKAAAAEFSGAALIAADPALAFARIAALFDPYREFGADSIHPSAVIAPSASIGKGCYIGPHCVIGENVTLGSGTRLISQVYVWHGVKIGARCQVQPGAVIGARGFGNVRGPQGWEEIPQLGSVVIGDDVEIGANTCIDRGTLDDTVIEDGVKIDNLVQIAHNVRIGRHTAIAACVGIAGSTSIGARCMIGGAVGISGHLQIGDDVIILAGGMVTKSLAGPGQYGSVLPAQPVTEWRRTVARLRRLEELQTRVKTLENQLSPKNGRVA